MPGTNLSAVLLDLKLGKHSYLDLQWWCIGAEGVGRLVKPLGRSRALTQLNLGANFLRDEGAEKVAIALERNTSLTELDLQTNGIGSAGARRLAAALESNVTLTSLSLRANGVSDEGARHLASSLVGNKTLTSLNLRGNGVGDLGAGLLGDALERNSTLTTLLLGNNRISAAGVDRFAQLLQHNLVLTTLDMESRLTGPEPDERIAAALERNRAALVAGVPLLTGPSLADLPRRCDYDQVATEACEARSVGDQAAAEAGEARGADGDGLRERSASEGPPGLTDPPAYPSQDFAPIGEPWDAPADNAEDTTDVVPTAPAPKATVPLEERTDSGRFCIAGATTGEAHSVLIPKGMVRLEERVDFGRVCFAGGILSALSGMVNGIALVELGSPPGYTSGTTMNMGRMLGTEGMKFFAMWCTYVCGGIVAGFNDLDGDAFVEGRMSPGLLMSAVILAAGAVVKKSCDSSFWALQLMSLSQGMQNAITSKFSSVPIRSTHTAGGMTDAGITIGAWLRAVQERRAPPPMRKIVLTLCTVFSFAVGGLGSRFAQRRFGVLGAFLPAALVALMAVASPLAALPGCKTVL